MKTITIAGVRYRLGWDRHHQRCAVRGPHWLGEVHLPVGVTLDSPDLRRHVRAAAEQYRANTLAAREAVARHVADGTAGIGR